MSAKIETMTWLNYHHLLYFWSVARAGSVTAACRQLRLAQPTVSAQIRTLERSFGHKLFRRSGRNLTLTETGLIVYRYANEIFSLGQELIDTVEGRPAGAPVRLRVGVADVLPKLLVYRFLEPALRAPDPARVICYEGKPTPLLGLLAMHDLDLVLSDAPIGPEVKLRAFNHLLGECDISIFAPKGAAQRYRKGFPQSLDGAPFLMPTGNTSLRRLLDHWFAANGLRPLIVAECEGSALLKVFSEEGLGLFASPSVIDEHVEKHYNVRRIGRLESARERYYAISVERQVKHPGVAAVVEGAHREIFGV
jgi:LysR family transcriptional regulator, transcriptional activator of nhaA